MNAGSEARDADIGAGREAKVELRQAVFVGLKQRDKRS